MQFIVLVTKGTQQKYEFCDSKTEAYEKADEFIKDNWSIEGILEITIHEDYSEDHEFINSQLKRICKEHKDTLNNSDKRFTKEVLDTENKAIEDELSNEDICIDDIEDYISSKVEDLLEYDGIQDSVISYFERRL